MPSLQIRDLPEPLHRLLQHRAQAHKRSISQQALVDLEAIAGDDARERRRLVLDRIARRGPLTSAMASALAGDQTPEALIRADRER
jgi:plasmid stability protein